MTQPGHDSIVLAIISRKADQCDRHTGSVGKHDAYVEAVIRTAVVDEYDFVPALDRQLLQSINQLPDAGSSVVDRDNDRERESERAGLRDALLVFSHECCSSLQRRRELSHRKASGHPGATARFRTP